MTIKRIALVGAGGVGKTTLMAKFQAEGFLAFPSIVREFYGLMGIRDESAYMTMEAQAQANFQRRLRMFYMSRYKTFLDDNPAVNTVTDRSLLDHTAFGIHGLYNTYTPKTLQMMLDTTVAYVNEHYTHLIFIPYPQPWMDNNSIEDGFRYTDPAKNYAISSIMFNTLIFYKVIQLTLKPDVSVIKQQDSSPDEIFNQIRSEIKF